MTLQEIRTQFKEMTDGAKRLIDQGQPADTFGFGIADAAAKLGGENPEHATFCLEEGKRRIAEVIQYGAEKKDQANRTNNPYLNHLAYEVQVVLDCDADSAANIVTLALGLGQDPVDFVKKVAANVGDGKVYAYQDEILIEHATATDMIKALEAVRATKGASRFATCFPAGYQNRNARRKASRKRKD